MSLKPSFEKIVFVPGADAVIQTPKLQSERRSVVGDVFGLPEDILSHIAANNDAHIVKTKAEESLRLVSGVYAPPSQDL